MAHDVFISYSSRDKPTADAVCAELESQGIRCWIAPRDVLPGMEWGEAITAAIEEAQVLVMVFSRRANESRHLRREVARAVDRGIAIVPFRIENAMPTRSLAFFIGGVHWLDALTPPLERHLKELATKVRALRTKTAQQVSAGDTDRFFRPPDPEPEPIPPPPARRAPERGRAEVLRFCTQCGAPNVRRSRFCTSCGAGLTLALKRCAACDVSYPESTAFCTRCSAPLSGGPNHGTENGISRSRFEDGRVDCAPRGGV